MAQNCNRLSRVDQVVPEMGRRLTTVERYGLNDAGLLEGKTIMGMKADRRTFLKLSSGAGAAALGGLTTTPAPAQGGKTLTAAWDTDIDSLDPHVFKSVGGYGVQCNLY